MPVILMTSDNQQFSVEKVVAQRSVLIKNMLEGVAIAAPDSAQSLTLSSTMLLARCRRVRPADSPAKRDSPSLGQGRRMTPMHYDLEPNDAF